MPIVFVKNTTILDIVLEDLGIIIPGSSIMNLTETFEFYEITSSDDLKNQISDGNVIINDGVVDLSKDNGLKHVSQESIFEDELKINRIVDNSESTTYSTSWPEKLRLDATILSGIYLLNWSYEIRSNTNEINNSCQSRVVFNDSNNICTNIWPYAKYQFYNGTDISQLTAGTVSIQIDFRRQGIYQPVYIRKANISLTKI